MIMTYLSSGIYVGCFLSGTMAVSPGDHSDGMGVNRLAPVLVTEKFDDDGRNGLDLKAARLLTTGDINVCNRFAFMARSWR